MDNKILEIEDFLEVVHSVGDHEQHVIATPNDQIHIGKIWDENLVTDMVNELMEVEDFLEDMHSVGESEKNVTFNAGIEIKIEDEELVPAMNREGMEVEGFPKDKHIVGDTEENIISTTINEIKDGNVESVTCANDVIMEAPADECILIASQCECPDAIEEKESALQNAEMIVEESSSQHEEIVSSSTAELSNSHIDDVLMEFPNDGIPTTSRCECPDAIEEKGSAQQDAERIVEESNSQHEEIISSLATELNNSHMNQSGSGRDISNSVNELIKSESSGPTSGISMSSKPDFSKLKGNICLNSLSVRELQETFRATFGRETTVKDKQWLKRRISMGLSNSCHVLSMSFIIAEGNTVKIIKEESSTVVEDTLANDPVIEENNINFGVLPSGSDNQSEDHENNFEEKMINPGARHDYSSEDQHGSGVGSKRVRKPTKRYIEELSDVESGENNGNLLLSKKAGHGNLSTEPSVGPACKVRSVRRPLVTRRVSLGGSGVWVPYVCRVRRSRPRENYMQFMTLQPGSMDVTTKHIEGKLGSCGPLGDDLENKVIAIGSDSGWVQKPIMDELEKEHCQERELCEPEKDEENVEPRQRDPPSDNSDNDTKNMEKSKGGNRRKHHRPWSLTEVDNLVEGVARYGAGRWSEIKRLSFASQSYRTSVDLKDKWRNLLRASYAQPTAEKVNSRKQVTAPIPPQILVRVRELAKMQGQVPPILSSNKFNSGNVDEASRGFL